MVRAMGIAAAKGFIAGSMHYTPSGVVCLAFAFVAAVAIVAVAVFGCAGHKSSGGKKPRRGHGGSYWAAGAGAGAGVYVGDSGVSTGGGGCGGGGGGGGGCGGGGGGGGC
ncbi:unnamed protein product [Triticum turgidum subsp. durum]|uniref:Loricrin-like n=1 Tax=Triticum turgidum subsp. durum TaxID=4567 RepID=A0A9R1Q084_TRITD|nr:unnamed protein product [Triticum turgidum subsp. durum]